jgi:hypothetical protein
MGESKITIDARISWYIACILCWFFFDWKIALVVTILVADIRFKK